MFLQDLRYAFRTLISSPGVTLLVVASLAIGIGANTAIFSVVNALLLKPLPYPDPDRLAILWLRSPGINIPQDWPSPGQFIDLQTENHSFQEMSISQGRSGTLLGKDQPERVEALLTSSSLFHLLGAAPLYGRLLLPEEDTPGKAPVVILSHAFWTRLFDADPRVIGRSITLNGVGTGGGESKNQYTVAGVLRCREMAIRAALGAGRRRLVRQLLTESVLLGLIGGATGLLVAEAGIYVVHTSTPATFRGSTPSRSTDQCWPSPSWCRF
jgi:hypothetical protein